MNIFEYVFSASPRHTPGDVNRCQPPPHARSINAGNEITSGLRCLIILIVFHFTRQFGGRWRKIPSRKTHNGQIQESSGRNKAKEEQNAFPAAWHSSETALNYPACKLFPSREVNYLMKAKIGRIICITGTFN